MAEEHGPPDESPFSGDVVERVRNAAESIRSQLRRVIVGQEEVTELLLISLFSRGHCLLEGAPGLAKTLLVSTLAKSLNLTFSRIQFTPDLMPADITGTEVIEENKSTGAREMRFIPGPIFTNVVLADEINRTPPKTQAALLEAMQEKQVTIGRMRHLIGEPFFVLATQNPIEQEGTYPLPEAQQDRFMIKALVRYPTFEEEVEVAQRTTTGGAVEVEAVLSPEEITSLQEVVRSVPVSDHVTRYAVALVRGTRVGEPEVTDFCRRSLSWGAGPRAVQFLILGGKARCLLDGRPCVSIEDIQALASPVLRHRLMLDFAAESEGVTPDDVVADLIKNTSTNPDRLSDDPRFRGVLAS
ncbi:ATPase family associated with various cellular activities (AAA) [Posidoniimonas polymericola]|uniref:ATPase family associated with various cellular activities (AAA) n=1 Tax=Posidoniimonas polymericola TaxID=2528002 RepID=A0A5C5YLK8_9BACT|nr:MoxR family ATPase [Posidoniimonas polymericola]TWT75833.1 ATPase family associated with various cellular activities (AAA) [Posidoniimonas polymericola]